MGWRYITYAEGANLLSLQIEPMAKGADIVWLPDQAAWKLKAPKWASDRSLEVVARLKSVAWNRSLIWNESPDNEFLANDAPVPGSIESTSGGRQLEELGMFQPDRKFTHEQIHTIWHIACQRFASSATGRVAILGRKALPDSVFSVIELPALETNPNVMLDFK